jgi:hypothetical protein
VDYNSTATYVYAMTAKRSGDVPIIRCNLLGNHLGTVAGTYVHYSLFKKQFALTNSISYQHYGEYLEILPRARRGEFQRYSPEWGLSRNTPLSDMRCYS